MMALFAKHGFLKSSLRPLAMAARAKHIAVILSGSGVYDGSEVHEASAALVALSRHGNTYQVYAPDKKQMHVIDHTKGEEMAQDRNVLVEAGRIARGNIKPLEELKAEDHAAVILPGGFGAAKNLSDFAVAGPDMTVDTSVEAVLKQFHEAKKPIGLCCIAPVIAAKVFPGCAVTVGSATKSDQWPYADTAEAIEKMGSQHVETDLDGIHIDNEFNIITSAAFMCEDAIHKVHDNVAKMVDEVVKRA
eukprot:TRINITY_DN12067_c0_g1_i3.p2 TRINITY_DN12067_c0_g1~~TRINITY_DN12067_c0_g1_i3.p2  ORF type:complete len:247 (+),score=42.32 TRINITY_DN12067_c0_g1_i3:22-762(+)